jgi:hypothetical protein
VQAWLWVLLGVGMLLTLGTFVLVTLVVAGALGPTMLVFLPIGVWGPLALAAWALIVQRLRLTRRLRATGLMARATVTEVHPTNSHLNNRLVLRIRLSVALPGQPAYPTTIRHAPPPPLAIRVKPGATLPVLVDPTNPAVVLLEWAALEDMPC